MFVISFLWFQILKVWGGMDILANKSIKPHPHPSLHKHYSFSKGYLYYNNISALKCFS